MNLNGLIAATLTVNNRDRNIAIALFDVFNLILDTTSCVFTVMNLNLIFRYFYFSERTNARYFSGYLTLIRMIIKFNIIVHVRNNDRDVVFFKTSLFCDAIDLSNGVPARVRSARLGARGSG